MRIIIDDLRGAEIARFLQEHLDDMHRHSPPGSVHALDLDALRRPDITFWTCWIDDALAGCGALRQLDPTHGEIKSMRTAPTFRQRGVAATLLRHIVATARERGIERLSLETGSPDAFEPARALYRHFGFVECGPFADYVEDPWSVFMTRTLHTPQCEEIA